MNKMLKGYAHARRTRQRAGEPFNRRPTNTMLKRKARCGLVYDRRRRLWVKRGGRSS